jgi:hypothetical protein
MLHARAKNASAVWLHVREDNPGAIRMYADLGFQEMARRTAWAASPAYTRPEPQPQIEIVPRHPRFWPLQLDWLRRLYPDTLSWYHSWNLSALRPGLLNWLYLLFVDYNVRQWAAVRGEELLATLAWMPQGGRSEPLYAALPDAQEGKEALHAEALTRLLVHARRAISNHSSLSLDYPAGEMTEAIRAAGFKPRRTLLWMQA